MAYKKCTLYGLGALLVRVLCYLSAYIGYAEVFAQPLPIAYRCDVPEQFDASLLTLPHWEPSPNGVLVLKRPGSRCLVRIDTWNAQHNGIAVLGWFNEARLYDPMGHELAYATRQGPQLHAQFRGMRLIASLGPQTAEPRYLWLRHSLFPQATTLQITSVDLIEAAAADIFEEGLYLALGIALFILTLIFALQAILMRDRVPAVASFVFLIYLFNILLVNGYAPIYFCKALPFSVLASSLLMQTLMIMIGSIRQHSPQFAPWILFAAAIYAIPVFIFCYIPGENLPFSVTDASWQLKVMAWNMPLRIMLITALLRGWRRGYTPCAWLLIPVAVNFFNESLSVFLNIVFGVTFFIEHQAIMNALDLLILPTAIFLTLMVRLRYQIKEYIHLQLDFLRLIEQDARNRTEAEHQRELAEVESLRAKAQAEAARMLETMNRELSSALEFNQYILRKSPLPMVIFDSAGQCVDGNEAYMQLVGMTHDALLSTHFQRDDAWIAMGIQRLCQLALSSNTAQSSEAEVRTRQGDLRWFEYQFLPVEINSRMHVLVQMVDITERKRNAIHLQNVAYTDPLTQLPNRSLLIDRLQHALLTSKRHKVYGALLFLDMNKFKQLNDTWGHAAGDKMLIEVGHRLKKTMRESDFICRLGGDEFVVLLENIGSDESMASRYAAITVEKIRQALGAVYHLDEVDYHSSASIGTALFSGDSADPHQILQDADGAMYASKRAFSHLADRE